MAGLFVLLTIFVVYNVIDNLMTHSDRKEREKESQRRYDAYLTNKAVTDERLEEAREARKQERLKRRYDDFMKYKNQ